MVFDATSISLQIDRANGIRISRPSAASNFKQRRHRRTPLLPSPRPPLRIATQHRAADQIGDTRYAPSSGGSTSLARTSISAPSQRSASDIESMPANLKTGRPSCRQTASTSHYAGFAGRPVRALLPSTSSRVRVRVLSRSRREFAANPAGAPQACRSRPNLPTRSSIPESPA